MSNGMEQDPDANDSNPDRFLTQGMVTEALLLAVALAIGQYFELNVLVGLTPLLDAGTVAWALFLGVAATAPLLAIFFALNRLSSRRLQKMRTFLDRYILPHLASATKGELLALALAAGIGEEVFFRGLLQMGVHALVPGTLGCAIAVALSAIAFGLGHWITATYALLAALVGVYFGVLLVATGQILVPIVSHALYDFVMLWILLEPWRRSRPSSIKAEGQKKAAR